MEILLLKIMLTCSVVLLITWVSETKGGFWGGVALGFPTAYAIILLFMGLSQSPEFVKNAVEISFPGFFTLFLFEVIWVMIMKYSKYKPYIIAPALGVVSVFLGNYILSLVPFSFITSILFGITSMIGFHFLFQRIQPKDVKITKKKLSQSEFLFRIMVSSSIIIILTEITNIMPADFSGMIAVFPTNILAILIILQRYNNHTQIASLIKYHPINLIHIVVFIFAFLFFFSFLPFLAAWALAFIPPIITTSIAFFLKK